MIRPIEVEPREGHRIWLRYSDGTAGEVDLFYLAGRGVFKVWEESARFDTVHIGPAGGIAWGENVECARTPSTCGSPASLLRN